jgi:hypothetical protein
MQKIVINSEHGGFGLSDDAMELYLTRKGLPFVKEEWKFGSSNRFIFMKSDDKKECYFESEIERNDPVLVQIVEELGEEANGNYSSLKVVEIPDDVGGNWCIEENDGLEHVAERHRTWS